MNSNAPTVSSPPDNSEQKDNLEQEQLLEQYKTYLDTIDHFAEKRLHVHEFFMGINSFLGTLFGYMVTSEKASIEKWSVFLLLLIALVGFYFSHVWYLLVTHFTTTNKAKWDVIYYMEKQFPCQPFQWEWTGLEGKGGLEHISTKPPNIFLWLLTPAGKFYSTADIDSKLPKLFGVIYIALGIGTVYLNWNDIVDFLKNIWHLCWEWVGILVLIFGVLVLITLKLLNGHE